MKIKKLVVQNYRNLKDISLEFGNLTIFIGKNDVGKSNILKVLDLFFNWMESKDYGEVSSGGGGNNLEYTANIRDYRLFFDQKPGNIELQGVLELNDQEIRELFPDSEIKLESSTPLDIRDIGNLITISKQITGKKHKKAIWKVKEIRMKNIILYSSVENKHLLRCTDGTYRFEGAGELISDKFLNLLRRKFLVIPAVRNIEEEGRVGNAPSPDGKYVSNAFFRYEKDTSLGKLHQFRKIREDVGKIFPEYQNVESKQHGEDKRDIYFSDFPSSSVGSGIKQMFVNIFTIDSYENTNFGIEEPEIHLHPDAQRMVFDFLKEQSEDKQIIITTHSPIFVDCSDETKLHLVKKNQDKIAKIKSIEEREEFKSIKYELGAKNTDLFFYNGVVLVEGNTEERALPILANANGYDLDKLGIKLINIKGRDRLGRIREFLEYIKDSDVIPFVIMDKDKKAKGYIDDLAKSKLLKEKNYHIWSNGDFEDCFNEEQIVKAMRNIYGKNFDVTPEKLRQMKEKNAKPTGKILGEIVYRKNLGELNKIVLGEELALIVSAEIEESRRSGKERDGTETEKVIEKNVQLVERGTIT